jgi:hypothetical protein
LKTGQAIRANNDTNNKMLNTLISAAGVPTTNFGGTEAGIIDAMKA